MTGLLGDVVDSLRGLFAKRGGGITEIAEGVSQSLRSYMEDHRVTDAELASDSYRRIMETLAQLEERVAADWEADKRDVTDGFWWWLKKVFTLGYAARQFNARVRALKNDIDSSVVDIRQMIERQAEPNIPVPDQLDQASKQWHVAANRASEVNQLVPSLEQVNGWGGAASSTYGNMVGVQIEASKEFQNLPRVMSDSFAMYRDLNKAVLCAAERSMRFAMVQADQVKASLQNPVIRLFRGLYPLSENWESILKDLRVELESVFTVSDSGSNSVGAQLSGVREALAVTQKGWPSGLDMAGTPAGDTSASISAHASSESAQVRYRSAQFGLSR